MAAATTHGTAECVPAADALGRAFRFLGKRWTALVLGHLSGGPVGFRELSRAVGGGSDSVLSDRLSDLAAGRLLGRAGHARPPGRGAYNPTPSGPALRPAPAPSA